MTRVETSFLGRGSLVAFVQDTPAGWRKAPFPPIPRCSSGRPRRTHRRARSPVLLVGSEALRRCRPLREHLDRRPSCRGRRDADRAVEAAISAPTLATQRVRLMIRPPVVAESPLPNHVRGHLRAVATACRARSTAGPASAPWRCARGPAGGAARPTPRATSRLAAPPGRRPAGRRGGAGASPPTVQHVQRCAVRPAAGRIHAPDPVPALVGPGEGLVGRHAPVPRGAPRRAGGHHRHRGRCRPARRGQPRGPPRPAGRGGPLPRRGRPGVLKG